MNFYVPLKLILASKWLATGFTFKRITFSMIETSSQKCRIIYGHDLLLHGDSDGKYDQTFYRSLHEYKRTSEKLYVHRLCESHASLQRMKKSHSERIANSARQIISWEVIIKYSFSSWSACISCFNWFASVNEIVTLADCSENTSLLFKDSKTFLAMIGSLEVSSQL